ncbi:MAG: hypothetical protein CMM47_09855 [Rhodospirillaceae bacterium]|nr:hypothetical protein [Rhodospirillaceae bacterium]
MLSIGSLAFLNAWLLSALLVVPALWLFLRVTPPAPRRVLFPAIRLLYRAKSAEEKPDTAPWWLLVMRLLLTVLVILALAHPVFNANDGTPGKGPVVIVIDDGWTTGRDWSRRTAVMQGLVNRAKRENRRLFLIRTTWTPQDPRPFDKPIGPSRAEGLINAMQPKPWPVRLVPLLEVMQVSGLPVSADVVWVSNGVDDPGELAMITYLRRLGSLTIVMEPKPDLRVLMSPKRIGRVIQVDVIRLAAGPEMSFAVRATTADGRVLARVEGQFSDGERRASIKVSLPIDLRNDLTRIEIEGESTAAAVKLLDDRFKHQPVGLVSETGFQGKQPLLDELYFIDRALAPFSEVTRGPLDALLQDDMAALILADVGIVPQTHRIKLLKWMEKGGVLVRFGGPSLAAAGLGTNHLGSEGLVPVRLRGGDRTLGGALSWARPLNIHSYNSDGPFAHMPSYGKVKVRRQVLAEPTIDLASKTWARLADGTPIVTAEQRGKGWLVLFHTTATPEWSDLALSGLFVDMLRRVVALSSGTFGAAREGTLLPFETLDGFGVLGEPPARARALSPGKVDPGVGPTRPPGYYGTELERLSINLEIDPGSLIEPLAAPSGVMVRSFANNVETDFQPVLFAAALFLFLTDMLATMLLRGQLTPTSSPTDTLIGGLVIGIVTLSLVVGTGTARAQLLEKEGDEFRLKASLETRLAYVITGNGAIDKASKSGLSSLSEVLTRRTAIEPADPVGLNLETDELAFFALIYWPITPDHPALSEKAARRVNAYMHNGGTVLFDTRDQFERGIPGGTSGLRRLRALSRDLDIPALAPVPPGHVLTKAFYLLKDFPGRFTGGLVWIHDLEEDHASEVTPVIIGRHDWVGAWARGQNGSFLYPVVPDGEAQREMAFRFGINLVMYALTGNYKADQVHVPEILERLGQ